MSKVTVTADVELKTAQIGIASETIQAVNKAADKICEILPPSRKHRLASSVKEFRKSLIHRPASLLSKSASSCRMSNPERLLIN